MTCRLCFGDCLLQPEDLYDEDGHHSAAYHIMTKYFPEFLSFASNDIRNEDQKVSRVMCKDCWMQINSFNNFQQTIRDAQEQFKNLQYGILPPAESGNFSNEVTVAVDLLKIEEVIVEADCDFTNIDDYNNDDSDDNGMDDVPLSQRLRQALSTKNVANITLPIAPLKKNKKTKGRRPATKKKSPRKVTANEVSTIVHPLDELTEVLVPATDLNSSDINTKDPVLLTVGAPTPIKRRGRPRKDNKPVEILTLLKAIKHDEISKDNGNPPPPPASRKRKEICIANHENEAKKSKKSTPSSKEDIQEETESETDGKAEEEEEEQQQSSARVKVHKSDAFIAEQKKELPCSLCDFIGDTFLSVVVHCREVHKMKRGYATCCDRKFFRRSVLVQHLHYHINPEHFKCKECGKCFSSGNALEFHVKSYHSGVKLERNLECEVCHKKFAKKAVLVRHMNIHATGNKEHQCTICGKTYGHESQLKTHTRYVHFVERRMCELCGKTCPNKYALKYHMEKHEDVKRMWPCDECNVKLCSPAGLRLHKSTMHGDSSIAYECGECGKMTNTQNALRNHKRYVHRQQRIHKCTICDKAFKVAKVLREHMTIHTGQHLYQCPYCPQTFRVSANMHHHRKRVHPKEWAADRRHGTPPPVDREAVTHKIVI